MSSLHHEVKELWILLMDGLISFYHEATERERERWEGRRERQGEVGRGEGKEKEHMLSTDHYKSSRCLPLLA